MPEIEEFLDRLTARIADKRKRRETREELRSHIEESAKYHIEREGYSKEEGYRKAMADMGDCEQVSAQLGEIHSFSPTDHFHLTIWLLFWGFLFSMFSLKFTVEGEEISTQILGNILMFVALYRLRRANRLLTVAFILDMAAHLHSVVSFAMGGMLTVTGREDVFLIDCLIWSLLAVIKVACVLYGIGKFADEKLKSKANRAIAFYALEMILIALTIISFQPEIFGIVSFFFFIFPIVFVLRYVYLVGRDVEGNEREVAVSKATGRSVLCIALAFLLAMAAPLSVRYYRENAMPEAVLYRAQDEQGIEEKAENIKSLLLDRFSPSPTDGQKELINDIRYSDLIKLEGLTAENIHLISRVMMGTESYLFSLKIPAENYGETERYYYYQLYLYDFDDNLATDTRAIQLNSCTDSTRNVIPVKGDYANLYEEDGKKMLITPDYIKEDANKGFCGLEFKLLKNKKNQHGYILLRNVYPEKKAGYYFTIYQQKNFFRKDYSYENLGFNAYINRRDRGWITLNYLLIDDRIW